MPRGRRASPDGLPPVAVTSCICHDCDFAHLFLNNASAYAWYGRWYAASLPGAAIAAAAAAAAPSYVLIDNRGPNGDGTLDNPECGGRAPVVRCARLTH